MYQYISKLLNAFQVINGVCRGISRHFMELHVRLQGLFQAGVWKWLLEISEMFWWSFKTFQGAVSRVSVRVPDGFLGVSRCMVS